MIVISGQIRAPATAALAASAANRRPRLRVFHSFVDRDSATESAFGAMFGASRDMVTIMMMMTMTTIDERGNQATR